MNLSNSVRRYIVIGLTLFVIVGLVTASLMGKKQDQTFQTNHELYNSALQQLQDQNYEMVLAELAMLENSQSSSETVNYIMGLAAANAGKLDKGIQHMQRVLDINPYKVEDSMFMLQLAEALVLAGMNEEAGKVLERCELLTVPESFPRYKERIIQLQEEIVG